MHRLLKYSAQNASQQLPRGSPAAQAAHSPHSSSMHRPVRTRVPTGLRTPSRPACCGTPATARPRAGPHRRGRCRRSCCRARLRGMPCTASAAEARPRPERQADPRPRPAPAARPCSPARGRAPPAAAPHPHQRRNACANMPSPVPCARRLGQPRQSQANTDITQARYCTRISW